VVDPGELAPSFEEHDARRSARTAIDVGSQSERRAKSASSYLRVGLSLNLRDGTVASVGPAVNRALLLGLTRYGCTLIDAACSIGSSPEASSGPTTLDLPARTMDPNEEEVLVETTVLAGYGWGGGPWFLFFPVLWIALFVGAFFLFRRRRDRWQTHSAEEVLAERYAKGEISADEYHQRLSVLRGTER